MSAMALVSPTLFIQSWVTFQFSRATIQQVPTLFLFRAMNQGKTRGQILQSHIQPNHAQPERSYKDAKNQTQNQEIWHSMKPSKLLITGSCGLIGRILWRDLANAFDLYGIDICLTEPVDHIFLADISNFEQVEAVFARIPELAYVVHLAGDPRVDADWQSVLVNNIVGTRNIFEAAKAHGIKRVVFASSNHVTGAYEGIPPSLHTQLEPTLISVQDPIRPDGYYGVSKAAGEAIARMYYELYGLESVCLRIGSVLKDDDPAGNARHHSTWLSQRDLLQLVKKSLLAEVKFAIYYGVSNNRKRFWDISNAVTEIDYQPEDDASIHR